MNRIFRIIWSTALRTWVVASEFATPHGKGKGRSVDKRTNAAEAVLGRIATEGWGLRLCVLAALAAMYAPAYAADRYWDVNGSGVGLGGTGIWNTAPGFWSDSADGVSGPFTNPWNNAAPDGDNAIFGGTAGTVTLGTPINVHNLTFNTTAYTLTGGTVTLMGATPTIAINSGGSTIASVIAGNAGLTKTGGGNLSLTGTNAFSGTIAVNAGALSVSGDTALGNVANGLSMANGTTLASTGALSASRNVTLAAGSVTLGGAGVGSARFTGTGSVSAASGVTMSNAASDYTGRTTFGGGGTYGFTSVADLGVASALGAPTTAANGLITVAAGGGLGGSLLYSGDGDSSNRDWAFANTSSGGNLLSNRGTGTLTLTGNIAMTNTWSLSMNFQALLADMQLLGTISSASNRTMVFSAGSTARTITLGGANTYTGATSINGVTVKASTLTNTGTASSFGTGTAGGIGIVNGVLSYTGTAASTDRALGIDGASTLANDGTGALTLTGATGFVAGGVDTFTLGGSYAGTNTLSGIVSGTGSVAMNGAGTWVLGGANTYIGTTTVQNGTLTAGSTQAFGASTGLIVNGGTLDLNDLAISAPTLSGTGGTVDLGTGMLTVNAASGSTAYGGSITGSGSLTKLGGSTLTLTGANSYTGATNIGAGTLGLSFAGAGGPTSNIIAGASTLNMAGGSLTVTGAAGEANTQTFNGLNVTAGGNKITTAPAAGGTVTVNLGSIFRSGGLIDFGVSASGIVTTTNSDGTLGGWATVNGSDYAKVQGGSIVAFTAADYTDKDDAATWLDNEFISDSDGDALSFSGTVTGNKQLGGLQYTTAANSTVNVGAGQTLGVDGTIIVASSVNNTTKTIQGGNLTGLFGGGTLGVLQNGGATSNFTIASTIVDNGGAIGFSKGGTGLVTLTGANTYTGATTLSGGTLAVSTIGSGGAASSIGASAADSSNLALENGTLRYTGASTVSNRGFTLVNGGSSRTIEVSAAATNLTFNGQVTSPDDAGFTKTGDGTLTLGNGGNDYVGVTTVSDGTLSVGTLANGGVASGIGASSSASTNLVLQGGGELEYTGATVGTDRGFTLGAGGGAVDVAQGATTLTVGGTVAGAGTLSKNGPGTLLLSGTNTFTGGGYVNSGVLQAGSTQAFGTGGWTIAGGATLDLNDFNNTVRELVGSGTVDLGSATLTLSGGGGFDFTGNITGTGGVTNVGGSQKFSGCGNTYTGATTIYNSVISTNCLANGGLASGIGASSAASANLTLTTNGLLQYTGASVTIDRGINLSGGWGYVDVTNGATTLGFNGAVVGGGGFIKRGIGTLVLSGNNTYTGSTWVEGGILRAGSTNAFGLGGVRMTNGAGATLDLNGFNNSIQFLEFGLGDNVALGAATLTIYDGLGATYAGTISGTGNVVKGGGGIQNFSGCSSYTGTTTISGTLNVFCLANGGSSSSIGASSAAASNLLLGGTLQYSGAAASTDRLFTLFANSTLSATGTGPVNFTNSGAIAFSSPNVARTLTLSGTNTGDNSLAAQITNNGTGATSLTKNGVGTWILNNSNSTYTGITRIDGGVLGVDKLSNGGAASSIGASSAAAANLVIGNGSTLRYTGTGDTTNRLFTLSAGTSFIESSGTGAVVFTDTGPVTLQTNNAARTIALGGTNAGNNTLAGSIGNAGTGVTTLAKNDSGTWVLTGNNTFTGNTVINDGNLVIGNGGTTGNAGAGNVIVNAPTSTLSINRSDAFNFTGTLSGPGTLAQIGTGTTILTSAGNSIGAARIDAGTLQVNGALTTSTMAINGASTLTVNGTVEGAGGTATLITGDAGGSTINVNGTLRANGDLGDGADTVNVNATLDTGTIGLNLGDGDDLLAITDGTTIVGAGIGAGAGIDTVQVDNALALTLGGASYTDFENLIKQNVGTLTLAANHTYAVSTQVLGGILDVDGTLTTATLALSDDTTLNVDGTVEGAGATPTALTGSAGVNTLLVNTGATLRANGDLGDGNDVVTLSGTLDTGAGTLSLGAGDDIVTLNDGAVLLGTGIDAGAQTAGDVLVLNNALGLTFDGSRTAGFESLIKQNTGTATMTGMQTFAAGTAINGGALDVDGNLITPTVTMTDGTALNVDGILQGVGGTTATITGSTGINTVSIAGTALATGDLGAGNDVLDVSGTLDTNGSVFVLGDGDDSFVVHDGTNVIGTIDGGAGLDSRVYDINTSANLGALVNFEGVTKTGTGTLNINGPVATDLQDVQVLGGTLNIGPAGSVVATAGSALTTVVGSGATLNVDGAFGCGSDADTMTVAGTVSGTGTINLCGGDDTLTLQDGAVLANIIDGDAGTADTVVLDNAGAMSFDGGNTANFEVLRKTNTGEATLTGIASYSGGTQLVGGTLTVDAGASLTTPTVAMTGGTTLNVDGALQGAGGTAAGITGSAGVETVNIAGTAIATGDLGAGNDTLDVTGTLDTGGGTFALGDGDDSFVVHDGTNVIGIIDGGAGLDSRVYDINATADLGALLNFEGITKTGTGTLNINGPAPTSVQDVQVLGGTLNIGAAGGVQDVQTATVGAGATLNVDSALLFTAGADSFTVAGNVTGLGTIEMLDGNDTLILQDGADLSGLSNAIDGGAGIDTLTADVTGTATLGAAVNFETLNKLNTGTLIVAGPAPSNFSTVNALGGTLDVAAGGALTGVVTGTVANGATLNVDGSYTGTVGNDTLTVAGAISGGGAIALGDGDDTLTLNDGADLSALSGLLDGGAHIGGDRVVLNNAAAMAISAGNIVNFEFLQKDNVGDATLNGIMSFTGGTVLNGGTLTVAGGLTTPTVAMADGTALNVDGALQGAGGTAAVITGSAGVNTVTVTGTAVASGDLGGGSDVLDVIGTLDTGGGVFALGDGDDDFIVHDGTTVVGTIDGGAGLDSRVYDITTTAEFGALLNFEGVTKRGTGTLNVSGPGVTALQSVEVEGGTLNIGAAGSIIATAGSTLNTVIASGATLNVDGSFGCGADADTMTVAGTVSGSGTVDLCGGADTLTLQDGSVLANIVSGGADTDTVVLDNASAMSFDTGNTINFEVLQKDNVGEATLTGTSTFTGGTVLNGGILAVAGSLITPTVAMADGTTLDVDGALQGAGGTAAAITGSAGVNTVNVTGMALVNGDLGSGNDVLDVTGTLNTGSGVFALGDGDDMLTIHDGTNIVGTVAAGAGNDTFNTDIATNADLGAVQGFETLSKTGAGVLDINGPMSSDFTTVNVLAGTVNVAAGGSVAAQNTTVAAGSTLQITGLYTGTAGNDSFTSMGTVRGALAFGAGADTARFVGGDVSGLTGLDGGAGSSDLLSFSGLDLVDSNVSAIAGWERMELLNDSALTLGTAFNLGGGVLAIDATSRLLANAGASIGGSVENAGLIDVGSHRLAIGGGYTGNAGALQLTVSPGTASSGGLNIAGDVVGTTRVVFDSDGSSPAAGTESIQVIASPNDNTGTAGGFVPDGSADGLVRLDGSPFPWTFEQQADHNWYLSAEATTVLPEINGYSVLDGLGTLSTHQALDMGHDRLGGIRGAERPKCDRGRAEYTAERTGTGLADDCHGVWIAATASELELGADPGVEVTGDDVGLYVGIDGAQDRDNKTLRGGAYLGYLHGVYWTTGANSGNLAMDPARVDMDAPVAGLYGSSQWNNGTFIDMVLSGQRLRANVSTTDGFTGRLSGDTLALSARFGRSYRLDNGWTLEPQVQLSVSQVKWDDHVDAGGRELLFDDDLVGKARAALRVEKAFATSGGAQVRPWATLGVQNVIGESDNGVRLAQPGSASGAISLPSHDLGTSASLDVGLDVTVDKHVSFFGAISVDQDLSGSDFEQRGANVGMRVRW